MQPLSAGPPPRRDPAPSRAAYRLHRLWLTPLFRSMLRVGVPAFCLAFGLGLYLSDADRRAAISERAAAVQQALRERPEFMVTQVEIEGASPAARAAVAAVLPVDLPKSSFEIDLVRLRAAVEAVDAVERADLRVVAGGTLTVRIDERVPAVLWRGPDGLEALDAGGVRVLPVADRARFAALPLVAGQGADVAVPEARALWAAAAPIAHRLRGLVRMGERRWDVVLDRDQRILLPEDDPVPVLERVIALDEAHDVLARDVAVVDMRNPARPTLRMTAAAVEELRRIRMQELEVSRR